MTDPQYSLIASKIMMDTTGSLQLTSTTAVLSDGSLFMATDEVSILRCQRLTTALDIIGTADVVDDFYSYHAIALPGQKVLLVGTRGTDHHLSRVVDCSGEVPVIGDAKTFAYSTDIPSWFQFSNYNYSPVHYRHPSSGFTVVGVSTYMMVWDDDGNLKWQGIPFNDNVVCAGVWPDPSDATKGVFAYAGYIAGVVFGYVGYALADDGSATFTSLVQFPASGDPGADTPAALIASPYLDGPALLGSDFNYVAGRYLDHLLDKTGAVIQTIDTTPYSQLVSYAGAGLGGGRMVGAVDMESDLGGYQVWLAGLGFSTGQPSTLEYLQLPILAPNPTDLDAMWTPFISADGMTGLVFVSMVASSDTDGHSRLLCWVIQGPVNMPNLSGQLLDNRVRFTGV